MSTEPDVRDFVREPLAMLRELFELLDQDEHSDTPDATVIALIDAKKTLDAYAADESGLIHVDALKAENARLREANAALASALRTVVDGTRRWNAAVEAVMGKFPDTGIDLTFADEALALHAKGAPQ